MARGGMRIGELATRADCPIETIGLPEIRDAPDDDCAETHVHGAHTGKSKRPLTSRRS